MASGSDKVPSSHYFSFSEDGAGRYGEGTDSLIAFYRTVEGKLTYSPS